MNMLMLAAFSLIQYENVNSDDEGPWLAPDRLTEKHWAMGFQCELPLGTRGNCLMQYNTKSY